MTTLEDGDKVVIQRPSSFGGLVGTVLHSGGLDRNKRDLYRIGIEGLFGSYTFAREELKVVGGTRSYEVRW